MSTFDFTAGQRRTVNLMIMAVIVVTSFQSWESPPPAATLPFTSFPPTPLPTPSSVPSPTPEGLWFQVQAARLFDQIAYQMETLRGLHPRAEVPLSFLDEREMTRLLRRLYAERNPQAELLPYTALGLLPDAPVSIRPCQVASIYVPAQQQLYVTIGQQESGADDQALLAHAYTRALQDQHFDRAQYKHFDQAQYKHFDLGAMGARTAVVWEHEDGRRVLVWRTVWDSTTEAAEFERAIVTLIPQRFLPAQPVDPPVGMVGQWWETDTEAVYVCRVARYVILVQAPGVNALANVVEVLP